MRQPKPSKASKQARGREAEEKDWEKGWKEKDGKQGREPWKGSKGREPWKEAMERGPSIWPATHQEEKTTKKPEVS